MDKELSEKDRRRLKRKHDLTRIRQKPEFRMKRDPGDMHKKVKHPKRWLDEEIEDDV